MEEWLWDILPWGYQILLDIEAWRNGLLDVIFPFITDFGSAFGYVVIFSVVYWCVDKTVGQGLMFAYLYTSVINAWIKFYFMIPRPDDPRIEEILNKAGIRDRLSPIRHETSPSFLSGHTQGALVVWGYLMYHIKKTWFRVLALIIIALIGFSRMYLGVHFPQDVIGGLVVGVVYLVLWIALEPKVRGWLVKQTLGLRYALAVLVPLAFWLVYPVSAIAEPMGAALGLGVGYLLEGQTVGFSAGGSAGRRVLRAVVGLVIVVAAYFSLSMLFGTFDETMGEQMEAVWRLVRYAIIGFGGGWFMPWLFVKTGLAEQESA
jgi:membrane-associated phospholipid phosphatase